MTNSKFLKFITFSILISIIIALFVVNPPPAKAADTYGWETINSPTCNTLRAIKGRGADDIYAAGDSATVIHYDGRSWKNVDGVNRLKNSNVLDKNTIFRSIAYPAESDNAYPNSKEIIIVGDKATISKNKNSDDWQLETGAPQNLNTATFLRNYSNFGVPKELYGYGSSSSPNVWFAGGAQDINNASYPSAISFNIQHQDRNENWNTMWESGNYQYYKNLNWDLVRQFRETVSGDDINVSNYVPLDGYNHGIIAAGGTADRAVFYEPKLGEAELTYHLRPFSWDTSHAYNAPAIKAMDTQSYSMENGSTSVLPDGVDTIAVGGNATSAQIYFIGRPIDLQNPNIPNRTPVGYNQIANITSADQGLLAPTAIAFSNDLTVEDPFGKFKMGNYVVATENGYITAVVGDVLHPFKTQILYNPTVTGSSISWYGMWNNLTATSGPSLWVVGKNGQIIHYVNNPQNQSVHYCLGEARQITVEVDWSEGSDPKHVDYTKILQDLK